MTWLAVTAMPLLATPSTRVLIPRFLSQLTTYDVARNVCQALA
jgi:hypothetical protein